MNDSSSHAAGLSNSDGSTCSVSDMRRDESRLKSSAGEEIVMSKKRPSSPIMSKKPKKKRSKSHNRRPEGKPTRPLSAYNLFFRSERERMMKERLGQAGDSSGPEATNPQPQRTGIGFEDLAKAIASKWRTLDSWGRQSYEMEAVTDRERYRAEMETWRSTDEGREHELQMKKQRMERAGAKFGNLTSGIPRTGNEGSGSDYKEEEDFDDEHLTPLQRMFRRGDAMVQQAEEKKRKEPPPYIHQSGIASQILRPPMPATNQINISTVSSSMVPQNQATSNISIATTMPPPDQALNHESSLPPQAWTQDIKALLSQGHGLLLQALKVQGGHSALELHSAKASLSTDAGLLPATDSSTQASSAVLSSCTNTTDSISPQHPRNMSHMSMKIQSPEANTKLCTSFLLPRISSSGMPPNESMTKSSFSSVSSGNSVDTINSLTNLLGSNQSIQGLLSMKIKGKPLPSTDSLKMILSMGEFAGSCSSAGLQQIPRNASFGTGFGLPVAMQSSLPIESGFSAVAEASSASETAGGSKKNQPLNKTRVGRAASPQSRTNATWASLPLPDNSSSISSVSQPAALWPLSDEGDTMQGPNNGELALFASMFSK